MDDDVDEGDEDTFFGWDKLLLVARLLLRLRAAAAAAAAKNEFPERYC